MDEGWCLLILARGGRRIAHEETVGKGLRVLHAVRREPTTALLQYEYRITTSISINELAGLVISRPVAVKNLK